MIDISPWELFQKKITWEQLNFIKNMKVLDFGSGNGLTADHFAENNIVTAIEPDDFMLRDRSVENKYIQIKGGIEKLKDFKDGSFDAVLCHNVLEYVEYKEEYLKEFSRVLKKGGYLSILKHNRAGRIMQMVVLLNNFGHTNELLGGGKGHSAQFGTINYYEDDELLNMTDNFTVNKIYGIRIFWDLQQNQEIQKDSAWQKQMLDIELKVSELEEFKSIAFFHHCILIKK